MLPSPKTRLLAAAVGIGLAGTTSAQCANVIDITPGASANSNTAQLTAAFGQELYFAQTTASQGTELWKWTHAGGVTIVADMAPGTATSNPEQLMPCCTVFGPRLFFAATETGHGQELYVSDGTAAGTGRLKEIRAGSASSLPQKFAVSGERVFFQANDGIVGEELWVSDGTLAGTVLVRDLAPGIANGRPSDLVELRGRVLFSADDGATGRELWISDGTAAGTQRVVDIWPGLASAEVGELVRVGDIVFFRASTATRGTELWRSDGTAAGTQLVADLVPGSGGSMPNQLRACGDRLFFRTTSGAAAGLWTSDGTPGGTVPLGGPADEITRSGNRVFFRRSQPATGEELWVSDGTLAGTALVADLRAGAFGSAPFRITEGGGGVFFVARTTVGNELWFSAGSAATTVPVCTPDPLGSYGPSLLTMCRGRLFFVGYSPAVGMELFVVATPGASTSRLGLPGRPDFPMLAIGNGAVPVLGSSVDLVSRGPSGQVGVLLGNAIGPPLPVPTIPGLIDGGCDWIGLQLGQALTLSTGLAPAFSLPLAVPNVPALEGELFHFQTLWWSPAGSPSFQLSNGLQLGLGAGLPH